MPPRKPDALSSKSDEARARAREVYADPPVNGARRIPIWRERDEFRPAKSKIRLGWSEKVIKATLNKVSKIVQMKQDKQRGLGNVVNQLCEIVASLDPIGSRERGRGIKKEDVAEVLAIKERRVGGSRREDWCGGCGGCRCCQGTNG